ncbi:MAG: transcription antitermination factor NusB [Acidobacteriota bacterium]
MGGRRRARELALQMMFQWDLSRDSFAAVRGTFWTLHHDIDDEVRHFADHLAEGTLERIERIDVLLARHAEHWRVSRMAAVDRNILRLATFELLHETQTPRPVIINEALEIARRFSTSESIQFINGILDSIRKDLDSAE